MIYFPGMCWSYHKDPSSHSVVPLYLSPYPSLSFQVCVSPIIKTIQSLGSAPPLKSLSLTLMVDLWQLQDRCFPQLLQMISDLSKGKFDIQLARAKAILDICKIR
jgi:hypothetical protein